MNHLFDHVREFEGPNLGDEDVDSDDDDQYYEYCYYCYYDYEYSAAVIGKIFQRLKIFKQTRIMVMICLSQYAHNTNYQLIFKLQTVYLPIFMEGKIIFNSKCRHPENFIIILLQNLH